MNEYEIVLLPTGNSHPAVACVTRPVPKVSSPQQKEQKKLGPVLGKKWYVELVHTNNIIIYYMYMYVYV